MRNFLSIAALTACLSEVAVAVPGPALWKKGQVRDRRYQILPRQLPAEPTGVQTIVSPNGINITFKNPGEAGVCETTPGVNSYAGFVNIAPDVHSFFWFFEARHDPQNAPLTLWLNGGPGSDSLIGLLQEHGPCNVTEDLKTQLNPYSWNEASNMLYLSQPIGVGFSYGGKSAGSLDYTGAFTPDPIDGRYPTINATEIDTTELAAMAAWEVIQGFYSALPQLAPEVTSKTFHLTTESYGGHYGPAFYDYFYQQNQAIDNGTCGGVKLHMGTLTIINGIIDEAIQAPYYPEFAANNTYGIRAINDTVYNYMKFALNMGNGCLDQYALCASVNRSTLNGQSLCAEAANMCRDNVEGPYYVYGGRGVYDIRAPFNDPTPPEYYVDFLNLPSTQEALGVDTNYTGPSNNEVYFAFQQTGDFVYPNFLEDLERILNNSVRVALVYGDADYICNWFGGEAVSLAVNYTNKAEFNAAGYTPMVVDGVEYGATREYGLFSFTRIYEAGHEVPYYQPLASLQLFNRTINGWDTATGTFKIQLNSSTTGEASSTHTAPFVPLPVSTESSSAASASATSVLSGNNGYQPVRARGSKRY